MDRITAIAICEALLYELQPFDEQPKEAFQMALDALREQEELGKELTNAVELIHKKNNRINELLKDKPEIVRCKDCKWRGNEKKCIVAFVADKQDFPYFFYDNHGEWFCADGVKKQNDALS